jgi:hypothetical protein
MLQVRSLARLVIVGILAACGAAYSGSGTATQTVSIVLSPLGKIYVPSSLNLLISGTAFSAYTGALPLTFRARTSASGAGSITVQANGDFTPAGGPSVASGMLTYTCTGGGYGSACSGTQTVSVTAQRPVLTLGSQSCTGGGSGCSAMDPASVDLMLRLDNDPVVQTDNYQVQLIFTISGT